MRNIATRLGIGTTPVKPLCRFRFLRLMARRRFSFATMGCLSLLRYWTPLMKTDA